MREAIKGTGAYWPARYFIPVRMRVYITVDTGDLDSEGCGIARR